MQRSTDNLPTGEARSALESAMTQPPQISFSPWRHGGWYAHGVTYPSGAIGCVSRNYPDGKWRIVCDPLPFEERPTFKSRMEAALAEWRLATGQDRNEVPAPARVHCRREGCGKTWTRDPALEVVCPTCRAPVGRTCSRPSEHKTWGGQPHAERDTAADQAGHYGPCPLGWCGLENKRRRQEAAAMPLFAAADMPRMDEPPAAANSAGQS